MSSRRDDRTAVTPSIPVRRSGAAGPGLAPRAPSPPPAASPPRAAPPRTRAASPIISRSEVVRDFRFHRLSQVSRAEVRLLDQVSRLLPTAEERTSLATSLQERLGSLFGKRVAVSLQRVYLTTPGSLGSIIPSPCFLARLAFSPELPRGLVEIELALAHAAIDQMLGGVGGEAVTVRPLTEIEDGLVSYLILEGLRTLSGSLEEALPLRMRLEGSVASVAEAQRLVEAESDLVVLQFEVHIAGAPAGAFRLLVPAEVIHRSAPQPGSEAYRRRLQGLLDLNRSRLAGARSHLWVEIGHCDLSLGDLKTLREGDVVLVDNLRLPPHSREATVGLLRVGLGHRGAWRVALSVEGERWQAVLESPEESQALPPRVERSSGELLVTPQGVERDSDAETLHDGLAPPVGEDWADGPPKPGRAARAGKTTPWEEESTTVTMSQSADASAGAALVDDIPLHVAVELARVPVTAEDVVALRAGQVIVTGKAPGDRVELTVNGKIVAHGELVEVEGQLGVRIVALSG